MVSIIIVILQHVVNKFYSIFDGNLATDGAAMNLAYYSARFSNVTFRNNKESAIRVSLH